MDTKATLGWQVLLTCISEYVCRQGGADGVQDGKKFEDGGGGREEGERGRCVGQVLVIDFITVIDLLHSPS